MEDYDRYIEDDFEWFTLTDEKQVDSFHDRYFGKETFSLSLKDLKEMVSGKYLAWTFPEKEYSHVLFLDEETREFLKNFL